MVRVSLLLLIVLLAVSPCQSALFLQFGNNGVVGSNAFSGSAGQTIVTQVYLTQSDGETRLSSPTTGLAIADFIVTIDGSGVSPVSTTFGPGFVSDGSPNTGVTTSTAQIAEIEASGTGNVGVTTAVDGQLDNSILLGTVQFQISSGANGVYNLSVAQADTLGSFSLASASFPTAVDVENAFGTLTVTAVPEPSSIGLLVVGLAYGCVRLRRNKGGRFCPPS